MNLKPSVNIFWFRRDLRLFDNRGLFEALSAELPVQCVFIFDTEILDLLEDKDDARVHFIHDELAKMQSDLEELGATLDVRHGKPAKVWKQLIGDYAIGKVYSNLDFEPYALHRDREVSQMLEQEGIGFHGFLDHLIFHPEEVLKDDGNPYVVFTPYSRIWKRALFDHKDEMPGQLGGSRRFDAYPSEGKQDHFYRAGPKALPSLRQMGFTESKVPIPSREVDDSTLRDYKDLRDFPAKKGTSRLGIHLRFGTVSVRRLARRASKLNETFLNELIWREFYAMILYHFPRVVDNAFREKYDRIQWRNNEAEFEAWCAGKTGYPLVDAGMRQLNEIGYMHNRVRMVAASFLTKHLLIDWRWGEAYFARKLLDFELASNNGGWQWAAGSGTDAAPYFRIFNPESQLKKFDPELKYVKEWVPEYGTDEYPDPIVEHKFARERCLRVYRDAVQ